MSPLGTSALLRSGLCPPASSVGATTPQSSRYLMGSHQAKKPPANSPHGNISILKRAANSPVQHHNLPQIYLVPLQLCISCLSLAGWCQRWQPPPQHPSCCTRAPLQSLDPQSWHPHCSSPGSTSTLPKSNSPAQPWRILRRHRA